MSLFHLPPRSEPGLCNAYLTMYSNQVFPCIGNFRILLAWKKYKFLIKLNKINTKYLRLRYYLWRRNLGRFWFLVNNFTIKLLGRRTAVLRNVEFAVPNEEKLIRSCWDDNGYSCSFGGTGIRALKWRKTGESWYYDGRKVSI